VLNVAHDPAVHSHVSSHRTPPKVDQGGPAGDFGSMVDSNAVAADRNPPAPSSQDKVARQANDNDRPPRRDDARDAGRAFDAPQSAPRTGVSDSKAKKTPDQPSAKPGLTEARSKSRSKDEAAEDASAEPGLPQPIAAGASNPNAVAAMPTDMAAKSDGASAVPTEPATEVAVASVQEATDTKIIVATAKPGVDPVAGHSRQSKTDGAEAADVAAMAGDDAEQAVSPGIVMPRAATAGALATGVVKAQALEGIAQGKSAKAPAKTAEADETQAKPGADIESGASDSDASSSTDAKDRKAQAGAASTKTDAPAAPSHQRQGADAQAVKPDASFQAALDLQPPATQPHQTQQPLTVTAAGPAASAQAASVPVPVNALAVDIATRAAAGNTSFQIRLDPAELGRIDVRLDVDKHGRVTSHLTVDQPATLDLLRRDAPQLQRALEDAGLKTGDGGLQFSLRDQSAQGGQGDGGQGRHAQRLIVAEEISTTPQVAGASYGRSPGSNSGVDISI